MVDLITKKMLQSPFFEINQFLVLLFCQSRIDLRLEYPGEEAEHALKYLNCYHTASTRLGIGRVAMRRMQICVVRCVFLYLKLSNLFQNL